MQSAKFKDIGLIEYKKAWEFQEIFFNKTLETKSKNRNEGTNIITENYLIFCEHPHVYTLGKTGDKENLLLNEDLLKAKGASFYPINRGGDITYHGPGQIVGYPILDLDNFFTDINKYLRLLEEVIILTLEDFGIQSGRVEGLTGVWLDGNNPLKARKICAMGVKLSRWVTMHGFAFNVNTDLDYFKNIIPCGISDKAVTSMENELGKPQNIDEIRLVILKHFKDLFGFQIV